MSKDISSVSKSLYPAVVDYYSADRLMGEKRTITRREVYGQLIQEDQSIQTKPLQYAWRIKEIEAKSLGDTGHVCKMLLTVAGIVTVFGALMVGIMYVAMGPCDPYTILGCQLASGIIGVCMLPFAGPPAIILGVFHYKKEKHLNEELNQNQVQALLDTLNNTVLGNALL